MKIAGSLEKPPRARVRGYEKLRGALRGAQRNAEKVGATEEIQSAEEGGSPLNSARARKDFQSHFSRSFFKLFFLNICFGCHLGV